MTDSQVKQTLTELLQQREYEITEEDEETMMAINAAGEKICAFLETVPKFNVKEFLTYVGRLNALEIDHGIIVYDSITSAAKKLLTNTTELKTTLELFEVSTLRYNLTFHRLVPPHIKVGTEEAKTLKDKYGAGNFPILKSTDAAARFYGFKKGDVIKIIRATGFVAYRIVR